ncbi:MAG TPA: lysylphosphatidylglycerol synthase transmembrane domain-containing protein [Gemmatimonadaceae bacterium]|nr:lysylphosphatidylglycerol synthase transmembrane domain-containing protein [Gemmatimonadaceae bacterium]
MLSTAAALALCLGLFTADYLARAWRVQVLARGLGNHTPFIKAFALNAASDATSALTPLKLGGEPVRFGGLINAGLNVSDTIALISVEAIIEWAVVITLGVSIFWHWGGAWWRTQQQVLLPRLGHAIPWVALIVVAGIAILFGFRKFLPQVSMYVGGTLRDSIRLARRMPFWAVAATVPITALHVVARIAILPAVFATLSNPPALGTVVVGSFVLLYGQNFLPTPSGAGAIELGFLDGAAGYVGPDAGALLVTWRFYTTLLPIGLGLVFGTAMYAPVLHRIARFILLRRRRARRRTFQRDNDAPG